MKCESCNNRQATVHLTEIRNGKTIAKHLCEQCAAQSEGVPQAVKGHTPINELLTNFVMAHAGLQKELGVTCDQCGITWSEFRQHGLFGCDKDYDVFEKDLTPLLQRAHEGATHHTGKVPTRAGSASTAAKPRKKVIDVTKLRKELQRAVEAEDYEKAARLRDQIRQAEEG
jgi:protein arginine kinase activator